MGKKCYWTKQKSELLIYAPGCKINKYDYYGDNKTINERGYLYCPYCGGKIEVEENIWERMQQRGNYYG